MNNLKKKWQESSLYKSLLKWSTPGHLICVVLCALVVCVLVIVVATRKPEEPVEIPSQVIEPSDVVTVTAEELMKAISPAAKLITYEFSYANASEYSKEETKFFVKFKDQFVYTYTGKISAGIKDLGSIAIDVDENNKSITVKMPKPEILANEFNNDTFRTYSIKDSSVVEISPQETNDMIQSIKEYEEKQVNENQSFWEGLKKNTEEVVKTFMLSCPIDEYTISFNWSQH